MDADILLPALWFECSSWVLISPCVVTHLHVLHLSLKLHQLRTIHDKTGCCFHQYSVCKYRRTVQFIWAMPSPLSCCVQIDSGRGELCSGAAGARQGRSQQESQETPGGPVQNTTGAAPNLSSISTYIASRLLTFFHVFTVLILPCCR